MGSTNDFRSLERLSRGITYIQRAVARTSAILLMFGLVVATANVLLKDAVFGGAPWLQWVWAWAQAIAVDANLGVIFASLLLSYRQRDWVRTVLYLLTGVALVFVAFVITDLEEVRQALDITLVAASTTVRVPLALLTQIRAGVVVGLVALSGIDLHATPAVAVPVVPPVQEELPPALPVPLIAEKPSSEGKPALRVVSRSVPSDAQQRVEEYLALHPQAEGRELERALGLGRSTVNKWAKRYRAMRQGGGDMVEARPVES